MSQWLLVGLGNPGDKHAKTRHNAGFMVLDALADRKLEHAILAKPQTYMNNSGAAVKSLYTKYKIQDTRHIIIIHDDIDLPLGAIKISLGSGSAGHKGVESIIEALGTQEFVRVRIGIQPLDSLRQRSGRAARGKPANVEKFVLQNFSKKEEPLLKEALAAACSALDTILSSGLQKAMNKYN